MATQIKLRRDSAANWASANPVLAQGEPGYDTSSGKLKIGDGATAWSSLPWASSTDYNDLSNTPFIPADVADLTDTTHLLSSGAANLGNFKITGSTLGTTDTPDTGGWGGYDMYLDPNGEGWAYISIPSVANQDSGAPLSLYSVKTTNSRIDLNTQDGVRLQSNRGTIRLGSDMEFPGAPSHFHIAFEDSNTITPTSELYFGDDFNYLRVISSGQGVEIGTNNRSGGPQRTIQFNSDGRITLADDSLTIQNGVVTKATNANVPNGIATVVWTSSEYYVPSAKLIISVESNEGGGAWHSQACEAIIAHRCFDNGTEPSMTVYGVVHTSADPLVTFSVRRNVNSYIEVVATTTVTTTSNAWIRIQSTEFFTND